MYRIIGKYAIELLTSGRDEYDEYMEMMDFAEQGDIVVITEELCEAELIVRDYV